MKRIKIEKLKPGDIVLTASSTKLGKAIRLVTGGIVSHAMICVQHSSVIDSTSDGVQARNLQREFFDAEEDVFVFRLREELTTAVIAQIVDFARSQIGTRYSEMEAARSVVRILKPRNKKQFCSRLVARAYQSVGIQLTSDQDYCTPEDLRLSTLLIELTDVTENATSKEISAWATRDNPIQVMQDAQNYVLDIARKFDASVENFQDLHRLVHEHPKWDDEIAQAYHESGYLDLWKHEFQTNFWRYDLNVMESIHGAVKLHELRNYCIETIAEEYSGNIRYATNLAYYKGAQATAERETTGLLMKLYETLVRNDHTRCEVARAWLLNHYPHDVKLHMERIEPHSELWFRIVDQVEPKLGILARHSIEREQSIDVCSSCGDRPARDFRIANSVDAMPGVPSLRLCEDCLSIRQNFGENLEQIN